MNVKIEAQLRTKGKKSDLKNLRKQGIIPAVIYGEGKEGVKISLEKVPFMKKYKTTIGGMAFYEITVEGNTYKAIMKDRQIHPVTREYMHIDFLELYEGKTLTLDIPVNYIGEPIGLSQGGILDVMVRRLEVTCLPKDIPDDIKVDISKLELNEALHLSDIEMGDLETTLPETSTLVAVRIPREEEEEEEEEEELLEGEVPEEGAEEEEEGKEKEESEKTSE